MKEGLEQDGETEKMRRKKGSILVIYTTQRKADEVE